MKNLLTICILLGAAALAGCAGIATDVSATGGLPARGAQQQANTYRLAGTPAEEALAGPPPYDALLGSGLAKLGFVRRDGDDARYLVSVSWATRPASVGVAAGDCAGGGCAPQPEPGFPWFGKPYVHELTLRFFALPGGGEVYKVSVVKLDRQADAQRALPYLVASALARLPYAGAPQWRVKLRDDAASGTPAVVSVDPLER